MWNTRDTFPSDECHHRFVSIHIWFFSSRDRKKSNCSCSTAYSSHIIYRKITVHPVETWLVCEKVFYISEIYSCHKMIIFIKILMDVLGSKECSNCASHHIYIVDTYAMLTARNFRLSVSHNLLYTCSIIVLWHHK